MKIARILKVRFLTALVCFILATVQARADIYMKHKMHGSSKRMGQTQPETDGTKVTWLGANVARMDGSDGQSFLVLADKRMMFILYHQEKYYLQLPFDIDKALAGPAAGDPKKAEAMAKMPDSMKKMMKDSAEGRSAKVTETNETKKIGRWSCRKYLIEEKMGMMGEMRSEVWATEDIKIDYGLYDSSRLGVPSGIFGQSTRRDSDEIVKEMKKIKGVIVYETATTKRVNFEETWTTELLECSEKDAPAGTYVLPVGYRQVWGDLK